MDKADLILFSNHVFTAENDSTFAGGVAICGNKIIAVGTRNELEMYIDADTVLREYNDAMIMPGFVEAHMHFAPGALYSSKYFISDIVNSRSEEECAEMVGEFARKHPEYKRIVGQGWFPANWNDAPLPTKYSLDRVVPDRPVYLAAADGHTGWLNSCALEEAAQTLGFSPDLEGYSDNIIKLPNGEASGVLREHAWFRFGADMVNFPAPEIADEVEISLLKAMNRAGITSLCEMSGVLSGLNYDALESIEKRGKLTARVFLNPGLKDDEEQRDVRALAARYHSDRLCVTGVKEMVDGVTSTYTGYLLEPYTDRPDTRGEPMQPREFYEKSVIAANRHGFSVRLHCIADGSVRLALDCFKKSAAVNDTSNLRNTIEHIENIHPDDIPRFAALNVVPSMQPRHLPLEDNEKITRMGIERCRWEWPFRSIIDSGAVLAFGTDYPVVDYDPLSSIYFAVTRLGYDGKPTGVNPQEAVSVGEALRAYTYGGAYATNRENVIGTLAQGKYADIIVVDHNLLNIPVEDIPKCRVILTVMDGEIVHEA